MVNIPKTFFNEGVIATPESKAIVAKLNDSKITVPVSSLVRQPSSDLFELSATMNDSKFWDDPQTMANYFRGEYLAAGGDYSKLEKYTDEYGFEYGKLELPDNNWLKVVKHRDGQCTTIRSSVGDSYVTLDKNNEIVTAKIQHGNESSTYKKENGKHIISDNWDGYPYKQTVYEKDGHTLNSVKKNKNNSIMANSGTITYYDKGQISKKLTYNCAVCDTKPSMKNLNAIEFYKDLNINNQPVPVSTVKLSKDVNGELEVFTLHDNINGTIKSKYDK